METNLFVYIINHNTIRGYKTKKTTVDFLSAKYAINFVVSSLNKCLSTIKACPHLRQRRRRRSGWSGQGRTTFQQVVGLISRLQRRSANEMVGPGVPRKLAFAQRVGVSRINRSRCFASRSWQKPGAARPDCIGTHVLLNTHAYMTCRC